ncbi:MAG: response regulator [Rhodospirillaceae bacterium]
MPLPQSLSVLIVDDQESMCMFIQGHLKKLGVTNIRWANSAAGAKEILKNHKLDLILSDFHMENGSGLDLLKFVRSNPLTRKTPFIMITGTADSEVVSAALQAGVNNYIVKPISQTVLRERVEKVLGPLR